MIESIKEICYAWADGFPRPDTDLYFYTAPILFVCCVLYYVYETNGKQLSEWETEDLGFRIVFATAIGLLLSSVSKIILWLLMPLVLFIAITFILAHFSILALNKTFTYAKIRNEKRRHTNQEHALALLSNEDRSAVEQKSELIDVKFKKLYAPKKKNGKSFIPFAVRHHSSSETIYVCGLQDCKNVEVPYFDFIRTYKRIRD